MKSSPAQISFLYLVACIYVGPMALALKHLDPKPAGSLVVHLLCEYEDPTDDVAEGPLFPGSECPKDWDTTATPDKLAKACKALDKHMTSMPDKLQPVMFTEGHIAGIVRALGKYAGNVTMERPCYSLIENVMSHPSAFEVAEDRAADLGLLRFHLEYILRNVGDPHFDSSREWLREQYYTQKCGECNGTQWADFGITAAREHMNDESILENFTLPFVSMMAGWVIADTNGSRLLRDTAYQLGMTQLGLDLIRKYHRNPTTLTFNISKEVITTMSGLCRGSPNGKDILEIGMQSYPTEVLKLMSVDPKDNVFQSTCLEFMTRLSFNPDHADTLVDSGAIEQTKVAMGNYTQAGGPASLNVDMAGATFLYSLTQYHKKTLANSSLVPILRKAVDNSAGGYGIPDHAARGSACYVLQKLEVDLDTCATMTTPTTTELGIGVIANELTSDGYALSAWLPKQALSAAQNIQSGSGASRSAVTCWVGVLSLLLLTSVHA